MMKNSIPLLIFLLTMSLSAQIEKIEPPFWWSEMKNSELQLLVYGKNSSNFNLAISPDIPIKDVLKTENPNYLFVTLDTKNVNPGTYKLTFKKDQEIVEEIDYEFKERAPQSVQRKGFSSADLIYLLMPDRFANGNPENDTLDSLREKADRSDPSGRHGGDITGITEHLDYLKELGATAIWSTPLLVNDEEKGSYHGYAQSDYYQIDPRFGSNEEYKRLADELHRRDMKLIMDYVTNHWGGEHWLIKDLPSKDWIHYWDGEREGYKNSTYRLTTQFDNYASKIDSKTAIDGWFAYSMPDMNQRNPLTLKYMVQNAIWWIEYAGLDGFRVDTYPYNDKDGITEWTRRIMEEYPNFNIVGEIWMPNPAHIAYWQKDSKIGAIQDFNSELPTVMDFPLHNAIAQGFKEEEQNWDRGVMRLYDTFALDFLYPDINNLMVFIENHDTDRFNEEFQDFRDYQLALTVLATVRGIPQIYYGSEIGMKGQKGEGDGDIRRDFPGGWPGDENNAFTREGRTAEQNQYFEFSKRLFNWRKKEKVIHSGKTLHFLPENNVYVYFRYNDEGRVMVVINNNKDPQTLKLERFKEGLQEYTSGTDILSDTQLDLDQDLNIEGKTPLIIELKKD